MDFNSLNEVFKNLDYRSISRVAVLIVVGLPLLHFFSRWVKAFITKNYSAQHGMIFGKVIYYIGLLLIFITIFHELGFSLAPLLGAAGILGVAIGFASQTSVSNIISGIFLVAEQPFVVGDTIIIAETTGQVLSIDTLSVKLRTFDNRFVRIPNETIIKSQVTNVTHFPIRRLDLKIGIAYKENVEKVREILKEIALKNPLALQEPEPLIIFSGFGASSIDLIFAIWSTTKEFLLLKNSIQEEIKNAFHANGIEIPFPHVTIYTGENTKHFPIKIKKEA